MKLYPFALSLCPLKGDYLDPGLSMMTGVKISSPLLGSPSNALFCRKIILVWCRNKGMVKGSVELKSTRAFSGRNVWSFPDA